MFRTKGNPSDAIPETPANGVPASTKQSDRYAQPFYVSQDAQTGHFVFLSALPSLRWRQSALGGGAKARRWRLQRAIDAGFDDVIEILDNSRAENPERNGSSSAQTLLYGAVTDSPTGNLVLLVCFDGNRYRRPWKNPSRHTAIHSIVPIVEELARVHTYEYERYDTRAGAVARASVGIARRRRAR
eukprot:COSAG02_NODE_110_length_36062_cov_85.812106_25_plen_186_part_00